jgi:hypothetical protein
VRYTLETPYHDGTTHIVLEPLDLMARLAALVPPARRGVGSRGDPADPDKPITPRHVAMCWAQRLKCVFGLEIDRCARCGGTLEVMASIEEPEVMARILAPLQKRAPDPQQAELPLGARAPPAEARLI